VSLARIDASAHVWDLSASLGRAIEFHPGVDSQMTEVVQATCNDLAVDIGLVKPPAAPPADATHTQRLMAAAGRTIPARPLALRSPDAAAEGADGPGTTALGAPRGPG
jgi:hypothetical protein